MPTATKVSTVAINAQLNTLAKLANGGFLRLYDGEKPASADDPASGSMVAELRLSSPAFNTASNGEMTARAIVNEENSRAGKVAWGRVLMADGTTVLWDGSVGVSGCDINLSQVEIQQDARIKINRMKFRMPK